VSPVRVAARRLGSRLAAWFGNGPGRSPASKAPLGGATQRSAALSEACRVVRGPSVRAGRGGAEPRVSRRRPWKGRGILERVPRNLPAYGAWNVEKVAAGTGEALPGPTACGCCCRSVAPYNRSEPGSGRVPGGRRRRPYYRLSRRDNRTRGDGKGRCFVHASREGPVSASHG
jgi:hypothetical protein